MVLRCLTTQMRFHKVRLSINYDRRLSLKHGAYSQGRVKIPTGGKPVLVSPRAPIGRKTFGVSRSGEIPEPTVTVRMGEDKA